MSTTPLLNCEQPLPGSPAAAKQMSPEERKKRRRGRLWSWVIQAVVVIAVIIWGPDPTSLFTSADAAASGSLRIIWSCGAWFLIGFASVWVNALGTVAAGWASGFELRYLSMADFLLIRQARGWRLRFYPLRFFRSFASMTTLSTEDLARRWVRMLLGGPVVTLILVVVALVLPRGEFSGILLLANVLIAALCWIPYSVRGNASPAKLRWMLTRKDAAGERLRAVLYLMAIDAQGIPPSDWPRDFVEKVNGPDVPSAGTQFFGVALGLRYAVARASNDPEAIAAAIEDMLASSTKLPPDSRRWLFTKAAGFQASFRKQLPLAEAWMEAASKVKSTRLEDEDWDAEALGLIALAKGDAQMAHESLTRYVAHVETRPLPLCGMLVAERERVLAVLNQSVT